MENSQINFIQESTNEESHPKSLICLEHVRRTTCRHNMVGGNQVLRVCWYTRMKWRCDTPDSTEMKTLAQVDIIYLSFMI